MSKDGSLEKYYSELKNLLSKPKNDKDLFNTIVNAPFHNKLQATMLDLGIVVFLQVNKKDRTIDRVALSKTEAADWSVKMTPVPFHEIRIPMDNKQNILAKTVKLDKPHKTTDWKFLFLPALSAEAARFNQAGAGIACSFTYPLTGARDGGAMIFSYYQPIDTLDKKHSTFMKTYSEMVIEALKN